MQAAPCTLPRIPILQSAHICRLFASTHLSDPYHYFHSPVPCAIHDMHADDETGRTIAGMGSFVFSMLLLSKIMA